MKNFKCKICKRFFEVDIVDFKDREFIKNTNIEYIQIFARWLRANDCLNKLKRKRSICFHCYYESTKTNDKKYLDGSYIK